MTTAQGNRLIMPFDGWVQEKRISLSGKPDYIVWVKDIGEYYPIQVNDDDVDDDMDYHRNWQSLMPVVQKIYKWVLNGDLPHEQNREYAFLSAPITSPINEIWMLVVAFIQWYNEHKLHNQ